jgi:TolB-like protein
VLAEAEGALVTKDELMTAVWPNIIVEENAIQAHVSDLRKILDRDAELLCTVRRLGYRLDPTQTVLSNHTKSEPVIAAVPAAARGRYSPRAILAVTLAAFAAAGSLWVFRSTAPKSPAPPSVQVSILPFAHSQSGPEVDGLANDLLQNISNALADSRILIADPSDKYLAEPDSGQGSNRVRAEFLLGGRIKAEGDATEVDVQLTDAEEHVVVWSGIYRESTSARTALVTRVATEVANAAHWGVIGRTGTVRLNAASVAALISARNSIGGVGRSTSALETDSYKKIIATAPDFTWGHSGLAAAYAFQLRVRENTAMRDEARQEAHRALELDPHNGEAYVALELMLPRFHWQEREVLLLKGIDADSGFEPADMMEGRLLWSVGRNHDALPWFRSAYNLDPLHTGNIASYAEILASEGYFEESRKLVAQMEAQWPEQGAISDARFWTSVISGSTSDTLVILADPTKWPPRMNPKSARAWQMALVGHASKSRSARSDAIGAINSASADRSLDGGEALLLLSLLNDIDGAFSQAQHYEPADPRWGPFLFLGPTKRMRFDRRFMSLAVRFGYAAYWRSTDHWPDFCSEPDLPYDCKAELAKLAAGSPNLEPLSVLRPLTPAN